MSDGTMFFLLLIALVMSLWIIYLIIGIIIARCIKDKVAFGIMFETRYECDLFTISNFRNEYNVYLKIIYHWWYIALKLGISFAKDLPDEISWKFERLLLKLAGKKI